MLCPQHVDRVQNEHLRKTGAPLGRAKVYQPRRKGYQQDALFAVSKVELLRVNKVGRGAGVVSGAARLRRGRKSPPPLGRPVQACGAKILGHPQEHLTLWGLENEILKTNSHL